MEATRKHTAWIVGAVALATLLAPPATRADIMVDYTTDGEFSVNGGPNTNPVVFGTDSNTLTITYTPPTPLSFTAPSFVPLGSFSVTGTDPAVTIPDNTTFTLTIMQSQPPPGGTASFQAATLTGTVSMESGEPVLSFPSIFLTIGSVQYELFNVNSTDNQTGYVNLNPQSTPAATLEAYVTSAEVSTTSVVPEPATVSLAVSGLATLLAYTFWRRRATPPCTPAGQDV